MCLCVCTPPTALCMKVEMIYVCLCVCTPPTALCMKVEMIYVCLCVYTSYCTVYEG